MFERFTDDARRMIVLSQEEARDFDHNYIGTEHILLGLLRDGDGVAARVLTSLGVTLDAAREQVVAIIGRGKRPQQGHIPFTARAKKVLEYSLRESLQLGHDYIGTEHLLLGIVREGEGVAAQILENLGADLGRVRELTIAAAAESQPPHRGRASARARAAAESGDLAAGLASVTDRLAAVEEQLAAVGERLGAVETGIGTVGERLATLGLRLGGSGAPGAEGPGAPEGAGGPNVPDGAEGRDKPEGPAGPDSTSGPDGPEGLEPGA